MSMLLARIMSKVAGVGKSPIQGGIRLLMTSSLPSSPYLLLSVDGIGDSPNSNGDKIANLNFYDPKKQKGVTMADQKIPESIHHSRIIGSSRGWMILMDEEDLTVRLTNIFNPSAPKSTHKVITLPVLLTPYNAPGISHYMASLEVCNVSLSSPPNTRDDDCIVAVRLSRSIAFYRMGDLYWRHTDSISSRCKDSTVVYSNKDNTFYLTPPTDTFFRKDGRNMPEPDFPFLTYYRQVGPLKHPKMGEYEYELLRRSTRTKHLVESPSGDFFIIVKYVLSTRDGFPWETKDLEAVRFMLYSHDATTRVECYIQDIGDLSIFLGKNEPFCLAASMYPGLKPNSIYFTEENQVYRYNIADQTLCELQNDGLISPIWLQPILHK